MSQKPKESFHFMCSTREFIEQIFIGCVESIVKPCNLAVCSGFCFMGLHSTYPLLMTCVRRRNCVRDAERSKTNPPKPFERHYKNQNWGGCFVFCF